MTTVVGASPFSDDSVLRAAAGDRDAYGTVFRAYAPHVFDLAARILRDRARALDVVRGTFADAWDAIADVDPDSSSADVLLFGTAARRAVGELRRGRPGDRSEADHGLLAAESSLADPANARASQDLADAVWAAAAALDPLDYAIADLWVRRRLATGDIAAALRLRARRVARRGPRVLDTLDATVVGLMIARHGRDDCEDIAARLDAMPAHVPHHRLREVVSEHISEGCLRCAVKRSSIVAPAELLASLAPIPFPPGTDPDTVWEDIRHELAGPRTKTLIHHARRTRRAAVVAGGLLAASATAAVAFVVGSNDGPPQPALTDPDGVRSASHEVGVATPDNRVRIEWEEHPGATGFSVSWAQDRVELPDKTVDVPGSATSTTSPALTPGDWWFALRTRGEDGEWTSTETVGPFVITPQATTSTFTPEASSTTSTTATRTATTRRVMTTTRPRPATTTTAADDDFTPPPPTRRSTTTTTTGGQPTTTTAPPTTSTTASGPLEP